MSEQMPGVFLPGGSRVEHRDVDVPVPGHGQVLVQTMASSICGSDIRAIYREHLGSGAEAYQDVIAGHEPAGVVAAVGPGCERVGVGDRVLVYHIAGCGQCAECRRGYLIGCTATSRAAYGWQRDGGHAPYLLAEERTCLPLPDRLSHADGALITCGFGTAYEGLLRMDLSGRDTLLVTGLGPVGAAAGMLARLLGAQRVVGAEVSAGRISWARSLQVFDAVVDAADTDAVMDATGGAGCTASIDCSGSAAGRELAVRSLRSWGRVSYVGEGGQVSLDVSELLLHKQVTVFGSWVTSLAHMAELTELLARADVHPDRLITHRYALADAGRAYQLAAGQQAGKVCLLPGE